ncbi:MAG: hypothetical protein WCI51_13110 [Lentisphaerota bacterium]
MTKKAAVPINDGKADSGIAGSSIPKTDDPVHIVPNEQMTIMDLPKKELNEEEKKLIDDAARLGNTYEKSTEFIHSNINIVMEVARHLHIICNYKLYRLHYDTFEEYVEEEFNYTRGRAYQLTRAYDIAEYINNKLGPTVLTTEPQCRELLRLRIYKDDEHEDEQQTQEARLALVKKILEEHKTAKTSVIAKKVDKELKAVHEKRVQAKSVDKYKTEIQSTVARLQKKITDILSSKEWSDNERKKMKVVAIQELKKILKSLK